MSTTFSVSSVDPGQAYWGLAILGSSESSPSDYILVDYQGSNGQFRIINVGGAGTGTAVSASSFGGTFALGQSITLTVTGTYVGSMLTLSADYDDGSPTQTITASAFDASTHYTGSAMGMRVRTPSGGGTTVNFDSFSAAVVPEPGTYAAIAGAFALLGVVLMRRK
ncbi:PEP-CTERM sorting domain-containing protein [Cerasicoccus fimbriatus]|uniref:PEP-CTERM sorting domain-containing protein n=1 Tax=Cerasicoccus fimbriatus TaxID=3014554 RepID=UPI0022B42023|nr:PEP-CTERM sorting domain-containing protein [Cerasicoccus sp. TK19100]